VSGGFDMFCVTLRRFITFIFHFLCCVLNITLKLKLNCSWILYIYLIIQYIGPRSK
jgi:hypothetical protein